MALGALVELINDLVVDEIVGEIDPVKQKRKIIDQLEVLILAFVADKKIPDRIHSAALQTTHDPPFLSVPQGRRKQWS
jgi:predicted ABC-class ATPase